MNILRSWQWGGDYWQLDVTIRRAFGFALIASKGHPAWRLQVCIICLHVCFDYDDGMLEWRTEQRMAQMTELHEPGAAAQEGK